MYKLFLITILSTCVYSTGFEFQVENPIMAQAYFDIFNAIPAIFSNSSYLNMLKLLFLAGGFAVMVKAIIGNEIAKAPTLFTKYMISGTFLMILVLGQTGDELIVTSATDNSSYCSQIGNQAPAANAYTVAMPGILPWVLSSVNTIGVGLTELAATAYSGFSGDPIIDNSFKSTANAGFGSQLTASNILFKMDRADLINAVKGDINSTTFGQTSNSEGLVNLIDFYAECLAMPLNNKSITYVSLISEIEKTGDIISTIDDFYNLNVINHYEKPKGIPHLIKAVDIGDYLYFYNDTYGTCKQAWNQIFYKSLIAVENEDLVCLPKLEELTPAAMYTMNNDTNMNGLGYLNRYITQAALLKMTSSTGSDLSKNQEFASAKTMIELSIKKSAEGMYMAEMLPYLQMGIRAVLYAFFPFVFLVMLLPNGVGVIKNYLQTLIWVELWSPVAAILNMFLSYFAIDKFSENIISSNAYGAVMSDSYILSGVAGYLYASVPALTFLIIKGSGEMLEGIGSNMAAQFSKNFDSENIRSKMSDIEKLRSYNVNAGTNNFINQAEQIKLDVLSSGIEGATAGKKLLHNGGFEGVKTGMSDSNAMEDIKKISYATNSTFEAQKASGMSEALRDKSELKARGILDKYDSINEDVLKTQSDAMGTEEGSDKLRAEESMDYLSKNLNEESDFEIASLIADSKSANFQGDIAEQQSQAIQYALDNGLKINGKNPNEATFSEVMTFAQTAEIDMGAQRGKDASLDHMKRKAISDSQGRDNGAGAINELTANAANKELIERNTDTLTRQTLNVNDIATEAVSHMTQDISNMKTIQNDFGGSAIKAINKMGTMQAQSEMWTIKSEKSYQNELAKGEEDFETEAMQKAFNTGKTIMLDESIKFILDSGADSVINYINDKFGLNIDTIDSNSLSRGQLYALLEFGHRIPQIGRVFGKSKKMKAVAKQKKVVKRINDIDKKIKNETDLDKKQKLLEKRERLLKEVQRQDTIAKNGFDPKNEIERKEKLEKKLENLKEKIRKETNHDKKVSKANGGIIKNGIEDLEKKITESGNKIDKIIGTSNAQDIVDKVNNNSKNILKKATELVDYISHTNTKDIAKDIANGAMNGMKNIKNLGVTTVKGSVYSAAAEEAVKVLSKQVEEGSLAHNFVMGAELFAQSTGEAFAITLGDSVPIAAAGVAKLFGYDTDNFIDKQMEDLKESNDRLISAPLMYSYTQFLNKSARLADNGAHYYYSFKDRKIMKVTVNSENGTYSVTSFKDKTDYENIDITKPETYQNAIKLEEDKNISTENENYNIPAKIEGVRVRENSYDEDILESDTVNSIKSFFS